MTWSKVYAFMGSGTTGVAAIMQRREFIGFELAGTGAG